MDDPKIDDGYLTGRLLLAMPAIGDARFDHAVILICAHDKKGAMGLVINNHIPEIEFSDMLGQIGLTSDIIVDLSKINVMNGGPVDPSRGFLLHSPEYNKEDTIRVHSDYGITGTIDALRELVSGNGPDKMLFMLGYSGWDAGQLDQELQQNAWLVVDADPALVFDTPMEKQWLEAVKSLGIDPTMLISGGAGQA